MQTLLRMILLHMTSWLLEFAGVAYSTLKNMNSCFVFQVNSSRTSASSFTTSRACAHQRAMVRTQMLVAQTGHHQEIQNAVSRRRIGCSLNK